MKVSIRLCMLSFLGVLASCATQGVKLDSTCEGISVTVAGQAQSEAPTSADWVGRYEDDFTKWRTVVLPKVSGAKLNPAIDQPTLAQRYKVAATTYNEFVEALATQVEGGEVRCLALTLAIEQLAKVTSELIATIDGPRPTDAVDIVTFLPVAVETLTKIADWVIKRRSESASLAKAQLAEDGKRLRLRKVETDLAKL